MCVVDDEDVAEAMVVLLERCKLVVEGAGAVGVAALLRGHVEPAAHGTTVAVLSGGNVDPGLLLSIARRHETVEGRRLIVLTRVPDRPGALARLLACVAEAGGNVVDVAHMREGFDLHVRESAVELVLETRGTGARRPGDDGDARRRLSGATARIARWRLGYVNCVTYLGRTG